MKLLRETEFSFPEIERIVSCHRFSAVMTYKKHEKTITVAAYYQEQDAQKDR